MADFKEGQHVRADFGNHEPSVEGHVIAHISSGPHTNAAGEEKYKVQAPDGSVVDLAYREPPFDAQGSGGTFKAL